MLRRLNRRLGSSNRPSQRSGRSDVTGIHGSRQCRHTRTGHDGGHAFADEVALEDQLPTKDNSRQCDETHEVLL